MGDLGKLNCCRWLWKVAQSPINRPIWSHGWGSNSHYLIKSKFHYWSCKWCFGNSVLQIKTKHFFAKSTTKAGRQYVAWSKKHEKKYLVTIESDLKQFSLEISTQIFYCNTFNGKALASVANLIPKCYSMTLELYYRWHYHVFRVP